MDLTEAEDIKKKWQEYTEELYKKDLHDPDNHDGVITDLEPDILECEVKWALESISTNKAAAAAKSLQSCPTLCDPIDGSPPGSPIPGILQEGTLEWVSISFSVGSELRPWQGHEEGGLAYAKVGSSLGSPPGNSRASTPQTRVCLLSALCFHLHL